MSPLTQGLNYRSACDGSTDVYRPTIGHDVLSCALCDVGLYLLLGSVEVKASDVSLTPGWCIAG